MPTARLTRIVPFSAAHRYYRPEWSDQRNDEAFGLCAREHGHGHNYRCHVTVSGPVSDETGMLVDLATLDGILDEEIRQPFDHRHLNHDVREFAFGKQIPTAEALAIYVWNRLTPRMPTAVRLKTVRIEEDNYLYAEYHGEP